METFSRLFFPHCNGSFSPFRFRTLKNEGTYQTSYRKGPVFLITLLPCKISRYKLSRLVSICCSPINFIEGVKRGGTKGGRNVPKVSSQKSPRTLMTKVSTVSSFRSIAFRCSWHSIRWKRKSRFLLPNR